VLDDEVRPDPSGDGYLLLYTRERGRAARLAAGTERLTDAVGFTLTNSEGQGDDRRAQRAAAPRGR
jgi:hypothetical protein